MKGVAAAALFFFVCLLLSCASRDDAGETRARRLSRLVAAYPVHIRAEGVNAVRWADGEVMAFDDGIADKSFDDLLDRPDLEDQMAIPYPTGDRYGIAENVDPGRVRFQPFFCKMYGASREEVEARLVPVVWMPKTDGRILLATAVNGVAGRLRAVSEELDALPEDLKRCAANPAGTVAWRTIAGTERLSPHCFGIAIDINLDCSRYWCWDADAAQRMRRCETPGGVPMEIVRIFERHGFIWGGKWYHYDTMHFEYRPELIGGADVR